MNKEEFNALLEEAFIEGYNDAMDDIFNEMRSVDKPENKESMKKEFKNRDKYKPYSLNGFIRDGYINKKTGVKVSTDSNGNFSHISTNNIEPTSSDNKYEKRIKQAKLIRNHKLAWKDHPEMNSIIKNAISDLRKRRTVND